MTGRSNSEATSRRIWMLSASRSWRCVSAGAVAAMKNSLEDEEITDAMYLRRVGPRCCWYGIFAGVETSASVDTPARRWQDNNNGAGAGDAYLLSRVTNSRVGRKFLSSKLATSGETSADNSFHEAG